MKKSKNSVSPKQAKRETVFEAAADVFAQYGFRRTAMNDIAQAAGISRPALYLLFENKEAIFRELVSYRLNQAINSAVDVLAGDASLSDRISAALLAFERVFYEPVAQSPHGSELMDISTSTAADIMQKGVMRLNKYLEQALIDASERGEVDFSKVAMEPPVFVSLLMSSVGGQKKHADSIKGMRRQVSEVVRVFLTSIGASSAE